MSFVIKTTPFQKDGQYHSLVKVCDAKNEQILGSSYKSQKAADEDARRTLLALVEEGHDHREHGYTLRVVGTQDGTVLILRRITKYWCISTVGPGRKRAGGYDVSTTKWEQALVELRKYAENFGGVAWETI